jgi:hypothetical protein
MRLGPGATADANLLDGREVAPVFRVRETTRRSVARDRPTLAPVQPGVHGMPRAGAHHLSAGWACPLLG